MGRRWWAFDHQVTSVGVLICGTRGNFVRTSKTTASHHEKPARCTPQARTDTSGRRVDLLNILRDYEVHHPELKMIVGPPRMNSSSFQDLLLDSQFTIAPRGLHPETFRMHEALEAGWGIDVVMTRHIVAIVDSPKRAVSHYYPWLRWQGLCKREDIQMPKGCIFNLSHMVQYKAFVARSPSSPILQKIFIFMKLKYTSSNRSFYAKMNAQCCRY